MRAWCGSANTFQVVEETIVHNDFRDYTIAKINKNPNRPKTKSQESEILSSVLFRNKLESIAEV